MIWSVAGDAAYKGAPLRVIQIEIFDHSLAAAIRPPASFGTGRLAATDEG